MASETYSDGQLDPIPQLQSVEANRRQRRHRELAVAMQEPRSNEIVDRSLNLIALLKVVGIVSELTDDLLDGQLRRMQVEQVREYAPLRRSIVLSRIGTCRPSTLLLHGSHYLLCTPPVVSAAGGTLPKNIDDTLCIGRTRQRNAARTGSEFVRRHDKPEPSCATTQSTIDRHEATVEDLGQRNVLGVVGAAPSHLRRKCPGIAA